jgi:hypothetical protein
MLAHAQIMYKSGGASPYCFGPAKSSVAGFSQTSLMFSSLKMLPPPHAVAKWLVVDSLPHCTSLFVPARHAEMSQNIGANKISALAKISLIFAKIQQSISLLPSVLSKSGKSKKQSPSLSDISSSTLGLYPLRHWDTEASLSSQDEEGPQANTLHICSGP